MHKFAHIADSHLGAFRDPVLKDLALSAFSKAIDKCLEEKVDFIILSGDLFDSNVPPMDVANEAVKKMKEARDRGIRIYAVYGSHDYSPNQTSIVDLLSSAGLIVKVVSGEVVEEKLRLQLFTDKETSVKLAGLSARTIGLERKYYEILDREQLEAEEGLKIFVFHSALEELKPAVFQDMGSIPVSYLPKGFGYYAGGHIHLQTRGKLPGYENIFYPGPLFGATYRDLEQSAKGEKRGFYLVTFGNRVEHVEFVELDLCTYGYLEYDASNKNSSAVEQELLEKVRQIDAAGKIVLLKTRGELLGGKTADINFAEFRAILVDKGAIHVRINRDALTSKEYSAIQVAGGDVREIEEKLLKENIGAVKVAEKDLMGEDGARLAVELLSALRQGQQPNEKKVDYETRMRESGLEILKLQEVSL